MKKLVRVQYYRSTTEFFAVLLLLKWLERTVSFYIFSVWLEYNRNKRVMNCQTKVYSQAYFLNGEFIRQSLEDRLHSAKETVEKLRNGHLVSSTVTAFREAWQLLYEEENSVQDSLCLLNVQCMLPYVCV